MRKEFGKIDAVKFGFVGYQDSMFGLSVSLTGKGWGTNDVVTGGWCLRVKTSEYTKWTEEDRNRSLATLGRRVQELMIQARVDNVENLVGTPVEVTFDGMLMKEWRILEEVL